MNDNKEDMIKEGTIVQIQDHSKEMYFNKGVVIVVPLKSNKYYAVNFLKGGGELFTRDKLTPLTGFEAIKPGDTVISPFNDREYRVLEVGLNTVTLLVNNSGMIATHSIKESGTRGWKIKQ